MQRRLNPYHGAGGRGRGTTRDRHKPGREAAGRRLGLAGDRLPAAPGKTQKLVQTVERPRKRLGQNEKADSQGGQCGGHEPNMAEIPPGIEKSTAWT